MSANVKWEMHGQITCSGSVDRVKQKEGLQNTQPNSD